MELSLTVRFRPPEVFQSHSKSESLTIVLRKYDNPVFIRRELTRKPLVLAPKTHLTIMAKKKPAIEGVTEEMNGIASQNLDFLPARRRVRSAFMEVQQRLDHCLFKMAPFGIRTEEWYEKNSRGLEIFCKSWLPKPGVQIKGALCFCHGYGDTCTFFFEGVAKRIADSGYGVYALDYPGFGLSEGLHGYIPSFDELVDDVLEQFTQIKGRPEVRGLPRFILGQSMGGAVTLKAHLKEPLEWDGVILVAPMCKIAEDVTPPEAVLKVLSLLSKVMPKAKLFPQKDLGDLAIRDLKKRKMRCSSIVRCTMHALTHKMQF